MSQATQTQTLEQTLNKTDLGHVLYEYRKIFVGIIVAILLAVTGWVIWNETQKSQALTTSVEVLNFQTKQWSEAQAGKSTPAELAKSFEALDKKVQTAPVMVPVALEMGKFLFDKGALAEAESILSAASQTSHHPVSAFFLGIQRSVILEKLGNIDGAIEVLEKLSQSKESIMASKIGIELGRLYLAKGEKGKAQSQFEGVISSYPNDSDAKLAKLYLSQLAQ